MTVVQLVRSEPKSAPPALPLTLVRAAERWRTQAQAEHASIAFFAKTSLELMSLGAPVALVRRVHQAAVEKADHATMCLQLAETVDQYSFEQVVELGAEGIELSGSTSKEALASSIVDGPLVEMTLSAYEILDASRRATIPAVKNALKRTAREKLAHVRLLVDIVRTFAPSMKVTQEALALVAARKKEAIESNDESNRGLGLLSGRERHNAYLDAAKNLLRPVSDSDVM